MSDTLTTLIADGAVVPVVLLAAWALLRHVPNNRKLEAYSRILMAGLTAYLCAKLIGAVYQPEELRPFQKLGIDAGASFLDNPGFPSDHVLFCMAITLAVWFETRKVWIATTLLGLTLVVGIGRVLALVHTPLDVIGGMAIASVGALWYLQKPKTITTSTRNKNKNRVK